MLLMLFICFDKNVKDKQSVKSLASSYRNYTSKYYLNFMYSVLNIYYEYL